MRDFLYSEIANVHGISNLPDDPELAIAAGRGLCEELLEPLQGAAGKFGDEPLIAGFDDDVSAGRGQGFLGPRGDNQGLTRYLPEVLRPLEPHFTKPLSQFLSPASVGLSGF